MGQVFDAERLEVTGQAFLVEEGVGRSSLGSGSYSASGTGTLAYAGTLSAPGRLTWFDRGGSPSDSAGSLGDYADFRLSPDQARLAAVLGGPEDRLPRADGREMYYLSADQKLMAVGVGPGPLFGAPTELFQVRVAGGVISQRTHYVPSRDGQRFLINTPTGDPAMVPITVVLNWQSALGARERR